MTQWEAWRAEIAKRPDFWPNTSEDEVGRFLFALSRMIEAKRILEIGVWMGYTQTYLLESIPDDGESWAIDTGDWRGYQSFWSDPRHHFVLGNSWEEIPKLPGLFDLAFLDTSHEEEATFVELRALIPKIKSGGLICCHDAMACPGVQKAIARFDGAEVEAITLSTPNQLERWGKVCGLGILKKQL